MTFALNAKVPAKKRLLEILHIAAHDFNFAQTRKQHRINDGAIPFFDIIYNAQGIQQLVDVRFGKKLAGVGSRPSIAFDGASWVLLKHANVY